MAQIYVKNQKFAGAVRVSDGAIQFRAEGRKNWYFLTGVGRKWILSLEFGRYGQFEVRKGSVLTLDQAVDRLFVRAKALKAAA